MLTLLLILNTSQLCLFKLSEILILLYLNLTQLINGLIDEDAHLLVLVALTILIGHVVFI